MKDKNITYKSLKQYAEHKRRLKEVKHIRRLLFFSILLAVFITSCFVHTAPLQQEVLSPQKEITTAQQSLPENKQPDIPADNTADISTVKKPDISTTDWKLILVNSQNKIPEDYSVELADITNGHAIDARAHSDLQEMLDACRAENLSPRICSSYRTSEKQQSLFDNKVSRLISEGIPSSEAAAKASTVVAVPGYSEHQTGLALDIVDETHQLLDESQESTAVQQWLLENSWKYGFILRYPNGKSDITGIIYEPWHYRYVGKKAAKEMNELDMCLEEYLEKKE